MDLDVERNMLLRVALHSPKDTLAACAAFAGAVAIMTNAMFLQEGRHPAPMFYTSSPLTAAASGTPSSPTSLPTPTMVPRPRPVDVEVKSSDLKPADAAPVVTKATVSQAVGPSTGSTPSKSAPQTQVHGDPVGDLIVSTRRIAAVQRVLTEFGYGPLKSTGIAGADTRVGIEKFERERKLPITGQVSDRLAHELSVATGRNID
jgi:hypothetical protein